MRKLVFVAIASILLMSGLCACGFNDVKVVEISFYDGNKLLETASLYKYNSGEIQTPQKDGYKFTGWFMEPSCVTPVDFSSLSGKVSVYAGWEKHAELVYYTVTFMRDEHTVYATVRASSLSNIAYPEDPQKEGYIFDRWLGMPSVLDSDVTLVAKYLKVCRVDFYVNETDTDVFASRTVVEGESAELQSTPIKGETKQASYTFKSWSQDVSNVHSNMKVYAVFEEHKIIYTATFLNDDGSLVSKASGYYQASYQIPQAEKEADESYVFELLGYDLNSDGAVDALPETLTYTFIAVAVYTSKPRSYTVNFYSDDTLVDSVLVEYKQEAKTNVIPQKDSDEQFDYEFDGWDTDTSEVTEDTDVHAVYITLYRIYTYKFFSHTGEILKSASVEYGTVIEPPESYQKPSDQQYDYQFAGWSGYQEGMRVTADLEFTAQFDGVLRRYTYKFIFNNKTYATGTLEYGSVIPLPDDPYLEGYEFLGWSGYKEIIVGNCEFTPKFSEIE